MPPHRRQAPTFGPNQGRVRDRFRHLGLVSSFLAMSFLAMSLLAESFFFSSRFFGSQKRFDFFDSS